MAAPCSGAEIAIRADEYAFDAVSQPVDGEWWQVVPADHVTADSVGLDACLSRSTLTHRLPAEPKRPFHRPGAGWWELDGAQKAEPLFRDGWTHQG